MSFFSLSCIVHFCNIKLESIGGNPSFSSEIFISYVYKSITDSEIKTYKFWIGFD